MKNIYQDQVELLLHCLPTIANIDSFALKGGTAINLFVRQDFPRLSVDIDLNYLPIEDRETTLIGIDRALIAIQTKLRQKIVNSNIIVHKNNMTKTVIKLMVERKGVLIKIEPNLILRGTVYPPTKVDLAKKVTEEYGVSVLNVPIVSKADLYGGKICAALDRQHPRDLFDVMLLLEEGITADIKIAFLVYLISHNRPMHELLQPNRLDQLQAYYSEFVGMTNIPVSYKVLEETREKLIATVNNILNKQDKDFLLSLKKGEPNWDHLGIKGIDKLPGVVWKLVNINKMDPEKREQALTNLEKALYANRF